MGKLLDRFGKGIRAAPTDALIADLSPRPKRSSTYGLHQSMTTLGGVVGSLAAMSGDEGGAQQLPSDVHARNVPIHHSDIHSHQGCAKAET